MHKRLKWNAIGLELKTKILQEKIIQEKENEPSTHSKKHQRLQGFLDELNHLLDTMNKIQNNLIPELEKIFRLEFKTPELIMLALSRPSIRNIYEDMQRHFKYQQEKTLNLDEYIELASSGDAADVLALIGDSAIDLAVVQSFWDSSLTKAGKLSKMRANIVANENLAKACDKWNLYNYRLNRLKDPSELKAKVETINHEKGTLVEAIYGVIYLEFGFEELLRTLPLIQ